MSDLTARIAELLGEHEHWKRRQDQMWECACGKLFGWKIQLDEHIAEQVAALAAPRTLATPDELDALPVGSVIVDRDGRAYQSLQRPGRQAPAWLARGYRHLSDEIPLPAQHVWTPNA